MEEYIEQLISQIRCKKARPFISDEIRGHIEEQIQYNKDNGMNDEEALKNAVIDMGDPVEVGISLDRIHKPAVAWNILIIVALLSALGIFVQWSIRQRSITSDISHLNGHIGSLASFIISIILGFIVMALIYFIDYTVIAKYSKIIGAAMIFLPFLSIYSESGNLIDGSHYYLSGFGFSFATFMMMFVPIYGTILYKYRGQGRKGIFKGIVWMIIPVYITTRIPNIVVAWTIMVCMLVQLSIAVAKGWYGKKIKRTIASLWTVFFLLPIVSFVGMYYTHRLAAYQEARIRAFFTNDISGANYVTSTIRNFLQNSALIGAGSESVYGNIPNINQDLVFTYIVNSYGIIAGILLVGLFAFLLVCLFGALFNQKNELGLVMGTGCGILMLMNIVICVAGSIGLIPYASSFLPFISRGNSNMILCYAFMGFIMSIYRYKNVYPKNVEEKEKRELKININL